MPKQGGCLKKATFLTLRLIFYSFNVVLHTDCPRLSHCRRRRRRARKTRTRMRKRRTQVRSEAPCGWTRGFGIPTSSNLVLPRQDLLAVPSAATSRWRSSWGRWSLRSRPWRRSWTRSVEASRPLHVWPTWREKRKVVLFCHSRLKSTRTIADIWWTRW